MVSIRMISYSLLISIQQLLPRKNIEACVVIFVYLFQLVTALVLYAIRKHIRMVIRLFKEGGKVAQSMPLILAQPFVVGVQLI